MDSSIMNSHWLKCSPRHASGWLVLVLWLASIPVAFAADYMPETTPRRGEKRFTEFVYKASHNSFRPIRGDLADQVDDYNVWQLELDVAWDDIGNGEEMVVDHDCVGGTAESLSDRLNELSKATTLRQKFTVIYLELKQKQSCRLDWPTQTVYRAAITNVVGTYLGWNRVYTPAEFGDTDSNTWPSWQELVRRGKNYAIVLQEVQAGGNDDNKYLFNQESDLSTVAKSQVIITRNGGYDGNVNNVFPYDAAITNTNRYLWRAFPGRTECVDTDDSGPNSFWYNMVDHKFTFVASNCIQDNDQILDTRTHSPQPLFVSFITLPNAYGTKSYPMTLIDGINRASPMVDVTLQSGLPYSLDNNLTIRKPLYLRGDGVLPVEIR